MTTCLLVNPAAGRGRAERLLAGALAAARGHWGQVEVLRTTGPGTAGGLAAEAARGGVARVLILGGDGTVHEAANGLLTSGAAIPPIGVLPIGSGNDFSNLTGTGRHPLTRVIDRLARGRVRWFDVGRAWDEYFVNSLGLGFDAMVASHVPRYRHLPGPLVYLAAALRAFRGFRPERFEIEAGAGMETGPLFCIEVGIGVSAGGGFYLTPDAVPDDGLFDVCVVKPFGAVGFCTRMPLALKGAHTRLREVRMLRTERLRVRTPRAAMLAHLDGELRCPGGDSIDITLEPRRLPVIVKDKG